MGQHIEGDNNVQVGKGKKTSQSIVGSGNVQASGNVNISNKQGRQHPNPDYGGGKQFPPKEWQQYWETTSSTPFIPCINWWNEHEFDFLKPKKKPPHKKKKKDSPTKQPPYEPSEKPYPYDPQNPWPWDPKDPWKKKRQDPPYPNPWPKWRDEHTEK
jgi:hypothetical protein